MKDESTHILRYSTHSRLREFHLKRLIRKCPSGRFLDVGCGLGYLAERLGSGFFRVGLDRDFNTLVAEDRSILFPVQGDASKLPFKPVTFDVILCSELLEHLNEGKDKLAVQEMSRMLKPGGQLLITVPSLEGLRSRSRLRNLGHDDPGGGEFHYRYGYTAKQVRDLARGIPGMTVKKIRYSMFLVSEIFMDLLKVAYLRKNKMQNHSDIAKAGDSVIFKVYRVLFPVFNLIFILEDLLLASIFKGHIAIVLLERSTDKKYSHIVGGRDA